MELIRLSERVWYYPFEEERDRPNLGYIRGDSWSLAVDADHSAAHTAEFYRALREAGYEELPENRPFAVVPGGKYVVTRNRSAVIAFRLPEQPDHFQIVSSHADSPTF